MNAIFIGLMLEGKRPHIFGTGEQVRDYLYVDDVVEANVIALERGSGEMLNLGTGVGTSVNDIVRELKSHPRLPRRRRSTRPRGPARSSASTSTPTRAKRVLGWAPKVAFSDGLRRTVEWSRKHPLPVKT